MARLLCLDVIVVGCPVITNLCTTPEGARVETTPDHHLSYEDGIRILLYSNLILPGTGLLLVLILFCQNSSLLLSGVVIVFVWRELYFLTKRKEQRIYHKRGKVL